MSVGMKSNITVNSDRTERDYFTRSGHNPGYVGYCSKDTAFHNGTYSSHPNLNQNKNQQQNQHRKLPATPNKPSSLRLGVWRQSSLPEEHNPPGQGREIQPLQPSSLRLGVWRQSSLPEEHN